MQSTALKRRLGDEIRITTLDLTAFSPSRPGASPFQDRIANDAPHEGEGFRIDAGTKFGCMSASGAASKHCTVHSARWGEKDILRKLPCPLRSEKPGRLGPPRRAIFEIYA